MSALAEAMMRTLASGGDEDTGEDRSGCFEAQVMELAAAVARYTAPCPFRPGDLVTPRANATLKGVGRPHVVLEVDRDAAPYRRPDTPVGSAAFGQRHTLRVASVAHTGAIVAHWCEHHEFEPWEMPA